MSTDYERDLKNQIEELESDIEHMKTQMKALFIEVVKDQKTHKNEAQFTAAARACSIVGISIEEQKEIEAGEIKNGC